MNYASIRREFSRQLLVLAMLIAGISMNSAMAHPRGHGADEHKQTTESEEMVSHDARLVDLQQRLDENPENEKNAAAFSRYAATQARRFGDTSLLRRAERALAPWANDEEATSEILIIRANVKQIDHRFDSALSDLDIVLKREPSNPQALLSRAFILATTGDAKLGAKDCAALRTGVSLVVRETCAARLGSLSGALELSLRRMEAVLQLAPAGNTVERNFALSVAAEIAQRSGADEKAMTYYNELFTADPSSAFARAAYADFLLQIGKADEARRIVGDSPHTEALLLISALAGGNTDNPVSRNAADELGARMASDWINGDYSHAREYARFALDYLDDPELAVFFAQQNWRVQKEPVDARILARAAIARGDQAVLLALMEWLEGSKLEDPELARLLKDATETAIPALTPSKLSLAKP